MSIVPLIAVTIAGPLRDKDRALMELQRLGCLHLESMGDGHGPGAGGAERASDALRFLRASPHVHRQAHDISRFDGEAIVARTLEIRARLQWLHDERHRLRRRIRDVAPWGEFQLPDRAAHPELRLWFYRIPPHMLGRLEPLQVAWQVVNRDDRFAYVSVVAAEEPRGLPAPRVHVGSKSLSRLEDELERAEEETDDLIGERIGLSRWCDLLEQNLNRLNDTRVRESALAMTRDTTAVFALRGWAPQTAAAALHDCAQRHGFALTTAPATAEDEPPTLLDSRGVLAAGRDLTGFYLVPAYGGWDPSAFVAGAFALFFAMILSDAGYGLLLAGLLAVLWRRTGRTEPGRRLRALAALATGVSFVWGVAVGSWFGSSPAAGTWTARLVAVDASDAGTLLVISLCLGIAHLVTANVMVAWHRRGQPAGRTAIGWVLVFLGAAVMWAGRGMSVDALKPAGILTIVFGLATVLLTAGDSADWRHRLVDGLLGVTRVVGALGDTLSYLRLFALGFAGASLGAAFNDLAASVSGTAGAAGPILAGIIAIVGHGLNLVLGVAGGIVHGLRLNFIEFFNWAVWSEGRPFRAFARTESEPWRTS